MGEESDSNGGLLSLLEPTNSCDITIGPNCVDGNNIRQQGKPKSIDKPIKIKQEIIKIKGKPTILQIKHNPFQSISNQTNIHNFILKKKFINTIIMSTSYLKKKKKTHYLLLSTQLPSI